MQKFDYLFKPLKVKGVEIRNRIVMAPMVMNFAELDGSVSERFTKNYVECGKGGVGLIIVSSAYIDPAARKRAAALLVHDDSYIPKLRKFTDAVHSTGAVVILQLNHNGRLISSTEDLKTSAKPGSAVGPSALPHLITGEIPRVLSIEEIKELIEKFGQAARRAKESGFDGVEIHASHGYLINQFFSTYSNRRTDQYGGTFENRIRFGLEVYHRVRELTGSNFLVSYRINAREFAPVETPFEDVALFSQRLGKEGVDFIHVSAGNGETPAMVLKMIPPGSTKSGCYVEFAAKIKADVKVPVIAVGRINTPELAEQILQEGKADLVAMGRAFIADPYWPMKVAKGELKRIRRCIGCNQGCMEQLIQEKPVTCIYNPEFGREGEIVMAPQKKKVVIVGGGPAGMEAAIIAAARGHRVELYEKESELGGQSLLAAIPPGKEEFSSVREFMSNEITRLKVLVNLKTEITPEILLRKSPDVVILATGAFPYVPDISGINQSIVITAWDVLKGQEVGAKTVVAGGGLVGLDTALFLARNGKQVIVIEKLSRIASDAGPLTRACFEEMLKERRIEVRLNTELLEISEMGAVIRDESGEYQLPSDTVIIALGSKSRKSVYEYLKGRVKEVYAVGDCVEPRNMLTAIHEGYDVGLRI